MTWQTNELTSMYAMYGFLYDLSWYSISHWVVNVLDSWCLNLQHKHTAYMFWSSGSLQKSSILAGAYRYVSAICFVSPCDTLYILSSFLGFWFELFISMYLIMTQSCHGHLLGLKYGWALNMVHSLLYSVYI